MSKIKKFLASILAFVMVFTSMGVFNVSNVFAVSYTGYLKNNFYNSGASASYEFTTKDGAIIKFISENYVSDFFNNEVDWAEELEFSINGRSYSAEEIRDEIESGNLKISTSIEYIDPDFTGSENLTEDYSNTMYKRALVHVTLNYSSDEISFDTVDSSYVNVYSDEMIEDLLNALEENPTLSKPDYLHTSVYNYLPAYKITADSSKTVYIDGDSQRFSLTEIMSLILPTIYYASSDECYFPEITNNYSWDAIELDFNDFFDSNSSGSYKIPSDYIYNYVNGKHLLGATSLEAGLYNYTGKLSLPFRSVSGSGQFPGNIYYPEEDDLVVFSFNGIINIVKKSIVKLEVTKQPDKVSYIAGQTFDKTGMTITATYNDGSTAVINDYTVDTTPLTAGQTSVYVTYDGVYTKAPISVADKAISSIAVTTQPNKTSYVDGEVFNPLGMVVTATYTDGSKEDLANTEYSYSENALQAGTKSITISAGGKTASVPITVVEKEITAIAVTKALDKISYIAGQSVDVTGMIVTATYNDGTTAVINDYSYSPNVVSEDTTYITISKDGKTATTPITVTEKVL